MAQRPGVRFLVVLATFMLLATAAPVGAKQAEPQRPAAEYVDGVVIAGFWPGVDAATQAAIIASAGAHKTGVVGHGANVLKVPKGQVKKVVADLQNESGVRYAEPDYIYRLADLPSDPSVGQLWGLENTGQVVNGTAGTADADVDAPSAWSVATGSADVVVGVVDTGIDYGHPDLAANVWVNPGGVGGCPAGTHGYNAIDGTCDPMDDNNHGSHTSGTIGAVGNNGIGVAGVNWTTRLLALKAFNAGGSTTSTSIARALQWAVDAKDAGVNIRVLNNSWGGWDSSQATLDLIRELAARDVLFVAAAGNYGIPNSLIPFYPCDYPVANIICVGATDQDDRLASFSNYGATSVDLGAPGVNILSTVPGGYAYMDGTSMATPHVTGAVALLLSRAPQSAADAKAAVLGSVDPVEGLSGKVGTGGRLNVGRLLQGAPAPGAPAAPSLTATAGDGAVDLAWTVPAAGDAAISGYRLYRGIAAGAETFLAEVGTVTAYHDPGLANGTRYWYQVAAVNAVGEGTRSPEVSAVPQVPATVPAAPVLSAVAGDGSVSLCWTAPPDGGSPITSYRVYRGPSAGAEAFLAETGTAASYSDTAVVNGQSYSYRVAAVNAVGEGPLSASVPAAPPGTPPSLGSFSPAVAVGGTSITIDGSNLGLAGCGTTVSFGTQPGSVTAGGGTSLTATSPPAGGSGKVTVRTPAGQAVSGADFFAVPAGLTPAEIAVTARMALGESRAVALPTAGTAALVLFDGAAGGRVSLNLSGSTISQGDLSIVRPDGTNLVAPAFFNTNGVFLDTVTLPVSGTYTIVLNPRTTYTGSATLTLYDVPPDLGGSITPGGAPLTVTLAIPGQNAKVTFAGTAGRRISLNLSGSTISQGDLSVVNPDGTNLAAPSLFTTNGIFLDTKTLPATGTYTILVNPRSFYTGKATLTLYDVPPDITGSITPGGAPVTVTLAIPGQNALLSFPAVAGSSYTLTLSTVTISQSDVSVLKPDGTNLVSPTFVNTSGKKIKFTAPTTGTYTIVVNPRGASTGMMTLKL